MTSLFSLSKMKAGESIELYVPKNNKPVHVTPGETEVLKLEEKLADSVKSSQESIADVEPIAKMQKTSSVNSSESGDVITNGGKNVNGILNLDYHISHSNFVNSEVSLDMDKLDATR